MNVMLANDMIKIRTESKLVFSLSIRWNIVGSRIIAVLNVSCYYYVAGGCTCLLGCLTERGIIIKIICAI